MLSSPWAGIQDPSSSASTVSSALPSGSLCARKEASFPEHVSWISVAKGSHRALALHLFRAGSFQPRVRGVLSALFLLRMCVPLSPQLWCRVNR